MFSYPNMLPLPAEEASRIAATLAPYPFERVYAAFWHREILVDGKSAVERSLARYVEAVTRGLAPTRPLTDDESRA